SAYIRRYIEDRYKQKSPFDRAYFLS
ncbi:MAG: hypothetical protein RI906_833, partial [Pseudomonadota bacterium]